MSKPGYVKEATECSEIPLNNVPCHIETKQFNCNALHCKNQLAGFYLTQVFIESNFRTNSNLN